MTSEEAVKVLESAKAEVEWEYPLDICVAIDVAIDAIKKRIPKKRILSDGHYLVYSRCPACKYAVNTEYCPECGQKIDWSDN